MGWFCCAVIRLAGDEIEVIQTGRVDTCKPGDLQSLEPYHVAGGWRGLERVPVPGDPEVIVREGLATQRKQTYRNLKSFLKNSDTPAAAAILAGRGRRVSNLEQALNSHAQIHMAEAHAVCDAIEQALDKMDVTFQRLDRKTLFETAKDRLGYSKQQLMDLMKTIPPVQGPWRQEEKQSAIAAWLSLG